MTFARLEDRRLISGRGRYTSDWNFAGQLHAAFARSDRPHARVLAIDVGAARTAPGVHAVLLASDVYGAGFKPFDWGAGYAGRGGAKMIRAPYPILAGDRVRHVGEPIAMVVADTPALARDAAELIAIDYEDLPAVVRPEDAFAAGAPQLHDNIPGNVPFEYEDGDAGAVDAAFARAKHVSRIEVESQRLISNPMEPRAVVARFNAGDGGFTVCTSTQGLNGMRAQLSAASGVAPDRLEVIAEDVGGSFGTRNLPFPEHLCVMAASRILARPVKWTGSRSEIFLTDWHGRALGLAAELAMDEHGNFLAMRYRDWGDLGAYPTAFGAFIATKNLTVTMGGVYRVPAMHAIVRTVHTNTTPVSAYRGAGRPDIAYAIERLVDRAARDHGFDPVELRRRNFVKPTEMPYRTANGTVYDCGEFDAAMTEALARADYGGFPARRAAAAARGRLRGIGIASFLEASGGGVAPKDVVLARFDANGRLTLYAATGASGQGYETSFPQIVAGELGTSHEGIGFRGSDPAHTTIGNGTGGSRTLLGYGSVCKALGRKLIEVARPHAAGVLECAEADLEFARGTFRVRGTDRGIGFFDLAKRVAPKTQPGTNALPHPLDTEADGAYGVTFPNGCHVCEVEIDPATGVVTIERYTSVDDFGTVVSPQLVEGQVHGGVVQGIGQVLGEQAIYDRASGQFLTGTFMDYAMPRAGIVKSMEVKWRPVPTTTNMLGAKGVGESGCSGAMPAAMNAVTDALWAAGVRDFQMPATPARVWSALQAARSM